MQPRQYGTAVALAVVCALGAKFVSGEEQPSKAKVVTAEKKSEYLAEFADYQTWKSITPRPMATAMPGPCAATRSQAVEAANPHADGFVHVYVNPIGRNAYAEAKPPQFAVGTVIVKAKLHKADDVEPHQLGIMIKRSKGFDPPAGDWQYLFVEEDGQIVDDADSLSNCRDCHQRRAAQDYVFRKHLGLRKSPNAEAPPESKLRTRSK